MAEPLVFGFDSSTADKLKRMANQVTGTEGPGAIAAPGQQVTAVHGRVSVAASAGSLTNPTSGKFKVRDIGLTGEAASLSSEEVDFVNPYDGTEFAVDWDGLFVDTGQSWVPVYVEVEVESGVGKGTLSSALASSDATASITLDSNTAVGTPGGSITANNFIGMDGASGSKCYISYDGTTWELIQLACP